MTRLSIVIPCLDGAEQFEETLASVLQNRPSRCEVIVLQPRPYDDPYDLASEVRFVEVPRTRCLVELINCGIKVARGEIIHLLSCDVEVAEGWTDAAVAHFENSTVGCVAPKLMDREHPDQAVGIGLVMQRSGTPSLVAAEPIPKSQTVGPTAAAGFYRRRLLLELGGFAPEIGVDWVGLDAALRMETAGYQAIVAETSIVYLRRPRRDLRHSIQTGRQAERFYWRQSSAGWPWLAWLPHMGAVVGELARHWYQPRAWLHFIGHALEIAAPHREDEPCRTLPISGRISPSPDRQLTAAPHGRRRSRAA